MVQFPVSQSPSIRPPEQRLRMYISANPKELAAERGAVRQEIARRRQTPVLFDPGGQPYPPLDLYETYLPQCDVFIGIYWEQYGWVAPGKAVSGLEEEYVLSCNLPRLIYVKSSSPKREPGLRNLLGRIKQDGLSYRYFSTVEELAGQVESDLAALLSERSRAGETHTFPERGEARSNLPTEPGRFIGREIQVEAIRRLLAQEENRIVSLTGPGGVGKTRLALEAASAVTSQFPSGIFYLDLSAVSDSALLLPNLAQATGEREAAGEQLTVKLKTFFHSRRALLVLDNLDAFDSAAALIPELLRSAPKLKALATGRTALHLSGEIEFPVLPLSLPGLSHHTPEAIRESEAVQLFACQTGSALTAETAQTVAEICRRLDGMPLAIELAAGRARRQPPADLLVDLDEWMSRVPAAAERTSVRERNQRAAIEWIYDRLNSDEKILFARLSVFHGGCTLDAVEAVCNPDRALDVLECSSALVDQNFLRRELDIEGRLRFDMLDPLRDFAVERLLESGEMPALRERHARCYRALAADTIHYPSPYGLERLEFELENLHAALAWSLVTPRALPPGIELANDLFWFWYQNGHLTEARVWFERLIQAGPDKRSREYAGMLAGAGMVAGWLGDPATAQQMLAESIPLLRGTGDRLRLALALLNRGMLGMDAGRTEDAYPDVEEALRIIRELNERFFSGVCLIALGDIALAQHHPDEARRLLAEATSIARGIGDPWLLPAAIHHQGDVARWQGDTSRAGGYYDESGALLHRINFRGELARVIHDQAYVALKRGDTRLASSLFRQSLAEYLALGIQRGTAECLAGLAGVEAAQGRWMPAARLIGFAEAFAEQLNSAWRPADQREIEAVRAGLQNTLGEELFRIEESAGRKQELEAVLAIYH